MRTPLRSDRECQRFTSCRKRLTRGRREERAIIEEDRPVAGRVAGCAHGREDG